MHRLFILALALTSCGYMVSEEDAIQAAQKSGLSNVRVTDSHQLAPALFGGCAKDDAAGFEVTGTNAQGKSVSASVCCGAILKGCTIRY